MNQTKILNKSEKMSESQIEYQTVKIPEEKIKNLKKALKKKGINARSNAEAVNVLINNFLLDNPHNGGE